MKDKEIILSEMKYNHIDTELKIVNTQINLIKLQKKSSIEVIEI